MAQHIGEVLDGIFDRGELPERIQMTKANGPHRPGDVLTWCPFERAYISAGGRWVLWAISVRQGWGAFCGPAPEIHTQQALELVA